MARGKYIAVLSGDDYWTDSNKIQHQLSVLEENTKYSMVHHNAKIVNSEGKTSKERYFDENKNEEINSETLVQAPEVVANSVVFKNVFDKLPDEFMWVMYEDRVITSTMGKYGKGRYINEIKSAYRKHNKSMYKKSKNKMKYKNYKDYVNLIGDVICDKERCRMKIKKQKIEVDRRMYTGLVSEGEYVLAVKASTHVFVSMIASGSPMRALKWAVTSGRFFLGHIKGLIF
jgi:hypothetical protein